jgi:hypothetical protein
VKIAQILKEVSRTKLLDLASHFEMSGLTGKKKEDIIAALVDNPAVKLDTVLGHLKRDELKALCRALGLDESGRERDALIARLTGKAPEEAAKTPEDRPAKRGRKGNGNGNGKEPREKSLENWIWDAACSIRGAKDAPKYKDFILPLIFTKRLCDVFDDELNRIAVEIGSRAKAFQLVKLDWHKVTDKKKAMVRFFLPLLPAGAAGQQPLRIQPSDTGTAPRYRRGNRTVPLRRATAGQKDQELHRLRQGSDLGDHAGPGKPAPAQRRLAAHPLHQYP